MERGGGVQQPDTVVAHMTDDQLVPLQSRRTFLAMATGAAGSVFLSPADLASAAANRPALGEQPLLFGNFSVRFTRTRDMIDLTFTFVNLTISDGRSGKFLTKTLSFLSSFIIVEFPPQHVAEEPMYFDPGVPAKNETVPTATAPYANPVFFASRQWHRALPVKSRFSGPSRLAFEVNPDAAPIPYTEAGLLNWTSAAFTPALVAQADSGSRWNFFSGAFYYWTKEPLAAPAFRETSIEFPYGLILTPTTNGFWRHHLEPVTKVSPARTEYRTEVWSTELHEMYQFFDGPEQPGSSGPAPKFRRGLFERDPRLRAVWTKDPISEAANGVEYDPTVAPAKVAPPNPDLDPPFLSLPNRNDRWQLVGQMTYQPGIFDPTPPPMTAKKFRMSSIGATVDMAGAWDDHSSPGVPLNLINYVHRAFAGRDVFVKVVTAGYLYPTMHKAAEVRVMERLFVTPPGGGASTGPVAYLQMWSFLIVRERTRDFGGDNPSGRGFPFTRVTLNIDATPPISRAPIKDYPTVSAYFPSHRLGEVFRFPATVVDQTGREHQTTIPLAFVDSAHASSPEFDRIFLANEYRESRASWRTMSFDGVRIGFAPDTLDGIAGKTSFPTFSITMLGPVGLDADLGDTVALPDWFPRMQFAGITVESLSNLAGSDKMFAFHYPDVYLNLGFDDKNFVGKVFARFLDATGLADVNLSELKLDLKLPDLGELGVKFPDLSKIGGLITPNFDLSGLSATLGTFGGNFPAAGLPDLLGGATGSGLLGFDPKNWFSGLPKILGGIDLSDILSAFGVGSGGGIGLPDLDLEMPKIPGLSTELIYKDVASVKIPIGVIVRYRWCTDKFEDWGPSGTGPIFVAALNDKPGAPKTELCLQVTLMVKYSGTDIAGLANPEKYDASLEAVADLTNFSVNLIGTTYKFVVLQFAGINFTAKTGSDAKVSPNLQKIDFDGALKYLMKLKDYFVPEGGMFGKKNGSESNALAGFKFTPIFELDKNFVRFGIDVGIPTLAVGVFSLSNLEVGVAFKLPFNSDPFTAYFHVCRADKPFLLTVGIFGGGGFFEMEIGLSGVRMMRIGLEFGAAAQLDIGVASGSVSVMGGISLEMISDPEEKLTLMGYVRLNGRLEILCIITLSLEFLLSLSYIDPPGTAKGRAQLTVTVEVVFFSADVTMEVEKEFGGNSAGDKPVPAGGVGAAIAPGGGTVRYGELLTFQDYETYVDAFA